MEFKYCVIGEQTFGDKNRNKSSKLENGVITLSKE